VEQGGEGGTGSFEGKKINGRKTKKRAKGSTKKERRGTRGETRVVPNR
jgi:hypothetical protein